MTLSRFNDLIRNKKDVDIIERKIRITIEDTSLHFIGKVRTCVHNNFV